MKKSAAYERKLDKLTPLSINDLSITSIEEAFKYADEHDHIGFLELVDYINFETLVNIIKNQGSLLKHVKTDREKITQTLFEINPMFIRYIDNPSYDMITSALTRNPMVANYVNIYDIEHKKIVLSHGIQYLGTLNKDVEIGEMAIDLFNAEYVKNERLLEFKRNTLLKYLNGLKSEKIDEFLVFNVMVYGYKE